MDLGLSAIMTERRQLINLAYRLLGSLADAEDVVQETYARWYAMTPQQRDSIESPRRLADQAHLAVRNPEKLRPWTTG